MLRTVFALGAISLASASHYRGGNVAWTHTPNGAGCDANEVSGNSDYCVTFTLTTSWRRSFEWPEDSNAPFTGATNPFTGKALPATGDEITLTGLSPEGEITHKNRWYGDSGPRGSYAGRFGPETQLLHGLKPVWATAPDDADFTDGSTQLAYITDYEQYYANYQDDWAGNEHESTGNDGSQDNYGAVGFWSGDNDQFFPLQELTGTVVAHNNVEDWIIVEHEYHYSYPRPYLSRAPYYPGPYSAGDHDGGNFNTGLAHDDATLQENQPFAYEPWLATFAGCCRMSVHQQNMADDVFSLKAEFVLFDDGDQAVYIDDNTQTALTVTSTSTHPNGLPMASCTRVDLNPTSCIIPFYQNYQNDEMLRQFEDANGPDNQDRNDAGAAVEYIVLNDYLPFGIEFDGYNFILDITSVNHGQYSLCIGILSGTSYTEAEIIVNIQDATEDDYISIASSDYRGSAPYGYEMGNEFEMMVCYVGFNCDFNVEAWGSESIYNMNYQWYSFGQQSATVNPNEMRVTEDRAEENSWTRNGEYRGDHGADGHSWNKYNGLPEGAEMFSINSEHTDFLTDLVVTHNNPVYRHRYNHDSTFDEESRDLWNGLLSEEEAQANGFTEISDISGISGNELNGDQNDVSSGLGGAIVKVWAKFSPNERAITDIQIINSPINNIEADGFGECANLLPLYYGTDEDMTCICVKRGQGQPITNVALISPDNWAANFEGTNTDWVRAGDGDRHPFNFAGGLDLYYNNDQELNRFNREVTWTPSSNDLGSSIFCAESVRSDGLVADDLRLDNLETAEAAVTNSGTNELFVPQSDGSRNPGGGEIPDGHNHLIRQKSEMRCIYIAVEEDPEESWSLEDDNIDVTMGSCAHNGVGVGPHSFNTQEEWTYSLSSGPGEVSSSGDWSFCPDQDWSGYTGDVCITQTDSAGNGEGDNQATTVDRCFHLHVARCAWVVQEEDTLIEIAARFNTNWLQIWHLNIGLSHPDHGLYEADQNTKINVGHMYTVEWHDNLAELADRFGTTIESIQWLNKDLGGENDIDEGQLICIQPNSCHAAEYTEDHKYNGEHYSA